MCIKHCKNHDKMRSHKCKEGVFESFFLNLFAYESLLLTSTPMMSILQSSPGNITSIAKVWTSARNVFVRALLLMKACSSWWSNLGQVCANLRRSSGIPGAYPSPSWRVSPNVGALFEPSRGGMLEVIGAVGSRSGLCWRLCCCYVTCFADMLVHLAAFSLAFDLGRWSFA